MVDRLEKVVATFQALSDPTRFKILLMLAKGERGVTSIYTELKMKQSIISHHLGLLLAGGFIRAIRSGKQIIYSLDPIVVFTDQSLRIGRVEVTAKNQT
jgi:DNA-binding transcriptional ArsR family regulator